jgi:GDPmannose 4,6-dehydratase
MSVHPASPPAAGRTALICGVGGQDGAYLAAHLLDLGYTVVGTSRDAQASSFGSLVRLGIRERVTVESMSLVDFRSTMQAISRHEPDEIYNLAGQTSVGLSFSQPVETFESIVIGTVNLLEAIRMLGRPIRLYSAGSSEMFGNTGSEPASERTVLHPAARTASPRPPPSGRSPSTARPTASRPARGSSSTTRARCGPSGS